MVIPEFKSHNIIMSAKINGNMDSTEKLTVRTLGYDVNWF